MAASGFTVESEVAKEHSIYKKYLTLEQCELKIASLKKWLEKNRAEKTSLKNLEKNPQYLRLASLYTYEIFEILDEEKCAASSDNLMLFEVLIDRALKKNLHAAAVICELLEESSLKEFFRRKQKIYDVAFEGLVHFLLHMQNIKLKQLYLAEVQNPKSISSNDIYHVLRRAHLPNVDFDEIDRSSHYIQHLFRILLGRARQENPDHCAQLYCFKLSQYTTQPIQNIVSDFTKDSYGLLEAAALSGIKAAQYEKYKYRIERADTGSEIAEIIEAFYQLKQSLIAEPDARLQEKICGIFERFSFPQKKPPHLEELVANVIHVSNPAHQAMLKLDNLLNRFVAENVKDPVQHRRDHNSELLLKAKQSIREEGCDDIPAALELLLKPRGFQERDPAHYLHQRVGLKKQIQDWLKVDYPDVKPTEPEMDSAPRPSVSSPA